MYLLNFRLLTIALLIAISLVVDCARQKRPPGGPVDITSPEIIDVIPGDKDLFVPLDSEISIYFSEIVLKPSAEKSIRLYPHVPLKFGWDSEILKVNPRDSLLKDTIYDLYIDGTIQDRDNNKATVDLHQIFTTADSLPSGSIRGAVDHLQADLETAKIGLFQLDPQQIDSLPPKPMRVTTADKSGSFAFEYLFPAAYHLQAFIDKNRDWKLQKTNEAYALTDKPVYVVSKHLSRSGVYLNMFLPGDPGAISGRIERADTLSTYKIIMQAISTSDPPDTLGKTISEDPDYTWFNVPAGKYWISAFIDTGPDSIESNWQFEYPDTVVVKAGTKTGAVDLLFK